MKKKVHGNKKVKGTTLTVADVRRLKDQLVGGVPVFKPAPLLPASIVYYEYDHNGPTAERIAEVNKLLDDIARNLNVFDRAGQYLWAILSALRGPDAQWLPGADADNHEAEIVKTRTTARLRAVIGISNRNPWFMVGDPKSPIEVSQEDEKIVGKHFVSHMYDAVKALSVLGRIDQE